MALKVTQEQLDGIELADKEMFVNQLTEDVLRENPSLSKFLPRNMIHYLVNYGIDRAMLGHSFTQSQDISLFVSIMFAIAPDFDQNPQLLAGLRDESLPMNERWMELSHNPKYTQAWGEADQREHHRNWFAENNKNIQNCYPLTYNEPGFIELYNKVQNERYRV